MSRIFYFALLYFVVRLRLFLALNLLHFHIFGFKLYKSAYSLCPYKHDESVGRGSET